MHLFLIVQRPLRLTLFPYTTLFRSGGHDLDVLDRLGIHPHDGALAELFFDLRERCRERLDPVVIDHRVPLLDRKSTRLNSSHSSISYAVFCLKKKTQTREVELSAVA